MEGTTSKIGSQFLLASTSSKVLPGRGSEKAFDDCVGVSNVFQILKLVNLRQERDSAQNEDK